MASPAAAASLEAGHLSLLTIPFAAWRVLGGLKDTQQGHVLWQWVGSALWMQPVAHKLMT